MRNQQYDGVCKYSFCGLFAIQHNCDFRENPELTGLSPIRKTPSGEHAVTCGIKLGGPLLTRTAMADTKTWKLSPLKRAFLSYQFWGCPAGTLVICKIFKTVLWSCYSPIHLHVELWRSCRLEEKIQSPQKSQVSRGLNFKMTEISVWCLWEHSLPTQYPWYL